MTFDVIVVGAGHAGCEAAWAAAELGCRVGLSTLSRESVALMPCNPAIGGTAKGHLVREIDALGGLMARAIDATGLQFKLLNRSRGPAVWSPRAQADKAAYGAWMRAVLEAHPRIGWVEGRAGSVEIEGNRVSGLRMEDGTFHTCPAVVVTAGTFLNGLVHIGPEQRPAGRFGEPPSVSLAESLRGLGLRMGRLKTGTPPRLHRGSVDFDAGVERGVFHVEHGDAQPLPFSYLSNTTLENTIVCHLAHADEGALSLVRQNVNASPLYNGSITGVGPRYCPSFEDKVMRFPDRVRHQLFLEPEGLRSDEIYVNGLSMSLPAELQLEIVRQVAGLERAEMIRPGYAVEYDFVQPTELSSALEARRAEGLFLAGQINGTSGYEEAAGQGLIAGVNAALRVQGRPPFALGRHEAYLGVMVDDLVTRGCLEPYRLFTSRAEHRLLLRTDNADLRLTPRGREIGLVTDARWHRFQERKGRFERNLETLSAAQTRLPNRTRVFVSDALRQPEIRLAALIERGDVTLDVSPATATLDVASLETLIKYRGYLERQERAVARAVRDEAREIPSTFSYRQVPGLSREMIQRFEEVRPATLGQASRIPGVTPAAVAVVGAFVQAGQRDGMDGREGGDRESRRTH